MNNIRVEIANPENIEDLRELTKQLVEGLGQKFEFLKYNPIDPLNDLYRYIIKR